MLKCFVLQRRTLLEEEVNETRRVRCSMREEASLKEGQMKELEDELYNCKDHQQKQSVRWQQVSNVAEMRNVNKHLFQLVS